MFLRLLWESFVRQRRRKALAGIAILLGTMAVTAMLALATSIGDRIHRELAVYGANLVVFPRADLLEVKLGGSTVKPTTGGAYLREDDLQKLRGIFWANNITGISPELSVREHVARGYGESVMPAVFTGYWFQHVYGSGLTGAPALHPWWKLRGQWPSTGETPGIRGAVLGSRLAARLRAGIGDSLLFAPSAAQFCSSPNSDCVTHLQVTGIVSTGDETEDKVLIPLEDAQLYSHAPGAIDRVDVSARTRPEDAFARMDPEKLSAKQHDLWYCRPYANSIAYQIREAIPGSEAEQVRKVEQSEGTVLSRISGLMWLVSGAALLAAGFAVSAAMATAVMERRGEIGLMRSLGASKGAIALLFYAESASLAIMAGIIGYFAGSGLAWWLGRRIFPDDGAAPVLNFVLLPVVVAVALLVALGGSTPSIRAALRTNPADTLRGGT